MGINCDLIKDLLPLYVEGLCSDYTKGVVEEHITTCGDCKYLLGMFGEQKEIPTNARIEINKLNPLKRIKRRNRTVNIVSIVCTIVIVLLVYVKLFQIGFVAPTSDITVKNIEMFSDNMTFSLELSSSDSKMKIINVVGAKEGRYTSSLEGDQTGNVYVKANFVLAMPFHQSNNYIMTFGFDQGGLGSDSIKAVYLVGKDESDIRLIWKAK